MKRLIIFLVIPLTIIIFATITKWWYVSVVDGTDEILTGSPFPFVCRGFHTSMSLQLFMLEFMVDMLIYFTVILLFIYLVDKFVWKIRVNQLMIIILYGASGLIISLSGLIASDPNNLFFLSRPFDIEIMDTGYKFTWQTLPHPDYYKYHPERRPEKKE